MIRDTAESPKSSPVRDLGPDEMDYERCAALHNEILRRGVEGSGRKMQTASPQTYWEASTPSKEITSLLRPSDGALFHFVQGLAEPSRMAPPGTFIRLYELSRLRKGDNEGILLNQDTMKASFIADYDDTPGVCALPFAWMPLEVILDAYLQMIDEGKVEYTPADVAKAAAAFKRLVTAIHARMPEEEDDSKDNDNNDNESTTNWNDLPWYNPSLLTQKHPNILPPSSFANEFLTATAHIKVRFRYIAPGLRFPTASEFLDRQPITDADFATPRSNALAQFPGNCPLRLFQVECDPDKPIPDPTISHWTNPRPFPAAFYIHPVVQKRRLCYINGCHLSLPFLIGKRGHARKSNREPLGRDNLDFEPKPRNEHKGLYQPGMTDGFGDRHDVQIHKVLANWAGRVERGDWDVNCDGVGGGN
ncbi:uncharacterized protein BDV14DRAFT_207500 [Aspergillus stella-maris]|uniref:uncharacterized protein n=1 Tax=Aspergillus stella-maris TaxID=1810926 RepID=UPI003CCDE182